MIYLNQLVLGLIIGTLVVFALGFLMLVLDFYTGFIEGSKEESEFEKELRKRKEFKDTVFLKRKQDRAKRINDHGNGILVALIATAMISIAMCAMMQLMGFNSRQQASMQRKMEWVSTTVNISNIVHNQSSCDATIKQLNTITTIPTSINLLLGDNTNYLTVGSPLGYQLNVTSIKVVSIGTAVSQVQLVTLNQNGNSNNYKMLTVSQGTEVQQAKITVTSTYTPLNKVFTQDFFITIVLDATNKITGCSL